MSGARKTSTVGKVFAKQAERLSIPWTYLKLGMIVYASCHSAWDTEMDGSLGFTSEAYPLCWGPYLASREKTKQNKTKQNKTKQNKTKQTKIKHINSA